MWRILRVIFRRVMRFVYNWKTVSFKSHLSNKIIILWEIQSTYLMPTKYKIFLGKGALPPCEHLAHRRSFQNGMTPKRAQRGRESGRTASLIFDDSRGKWASRGNFKLVEAWNIWWKWYKLKIHYEIMWILPSGTGFPGLLKH